MRQTLPIRMGLTTHFISHPNTLSNSRNQRFLFIVYRRIYLCMVTATVLTSTSLLPIRKAIQLPNSLKFWVCVSWMAPLTVLYSSLGTYSYIDLTLASPSIAPLYNWKLLNDIYGSDPFPFAPSSSSLAEQNLLWKLHEADWNKLEALCIDQFAKFIYLTRHWILFLNSSLKSSPYKLRRKPWFIDKCKKIVTQRKKWFSSFLTWSHLG